MGESIVGPITRKDIRSFFDKVGHDHLEKFVRHRIGDERTRSSPLGPLSRLGVRYGLGSSAFSLVNGLPSTISFGPPLPSFDWERVRKFGLELHPEKTRLIEFGRYAAERREKRGEGKPKTSLTSVGGITRRGTSRCTGRRSASVWQPS
jgi:hypothetical protein